MDIISKYDTISNKDIYAVISRKEILKLIDEKDFKEKKSELVLISISEPITEKYKDESLSDEIVKDFKKELRVKFWDITKPMDDMDIISNELAKKIRDFILDNKEEQFIVHCRAGKSRSAGVARAIECIKHFGIGSEAVYNYKQGFDTILSKNKRYVPNLTVFDKILGL